MCHRPWPHTQTQDRVRDIPDTMHGPGSTDSCVHNPYRYHRLVSAPTSQLHTNANLAAQTQPLLLVGGSKTTPMHGQDSVIICFIILLYENHHRMSYT